MFKPRSEEKVKSIVAKTVSMNREVNVPLVKTTNGKDYDPKRKTSSVGSVADATDPEAEQAVQAQESKRRKRRILKIAVYCMFAIIVMGVFAIWLFHKDSVESLRFGSMFLLTVKLRSLEVKDREGKSVLYGDMGRHLMATPYDHCWDASYKSYEPDCIQWRHKARLLVDYYKPWNETARGGCYTMRWLALDESFLAEDCYYLQDYHFYGALTNHAASWPIQNVQLRSETQYYAEYPKEQRDNKVPVWFGSQGVAIYVDSSFPFTLSWNNTEKRQFCLTSQVQGDFTYGREMLRYTVCQADDIQDVYEGARRHRQDTDPDFTATSSQAAGQTILPQPMHTLARLSDLGELAGTDCSLVEMLHGWEENYGDLSLNSSLLGDLEQSLPALEQRGCHVVLPVSTFFSYRSVHFTEGIERKYFVQDRQNLVTLMLQWRGGQGAALDVTNPEAVDWFLGHVGAVITQLGARAVRLLYLNIPADASYHDQNMTHLDYTRIFYRDLATLNVSLVLERATGFIPVPVYTPVPAIVDHRGQCLQTLVPHSLTLGMSGYPLLVAQTDGDWRDSAELLQRWLQVAIFFPVIELPSWPSDQPMQDFLKDMLALRERDLLGYMSDTWERQPELPLLRPLIWAWPSDKQAQLIGDQFMLGDSLMVAPVTCQKVTARSVYLPEGRWRKPSGDIVIGPIKVQEDVSSMSVVLYYWRE